MKLSTLLISVTAGILTAGTSLANDRIRLECRDDSSSWDASITARHELRNPTSRKREKFTVEFEAMPGGPFQAGDNLEIRVDGELVGKFILADAGMIVADLNFDTTAQPDDQDMPFPANFPATSAGTIVSVGGEFACSLQVR